MGLVCTLGSYTVTAKTETGLDEESYREWVVTFSTPTDSAASHW
ncbi:hypothetical protein EYZ11_008964 [Aspergillus tanneri]|uniref:Uncharacterized protein n=1 Tax=Aspergillus tanneri TaxID=1220188 RepID=A0A4S3J937_9EURO|nr:hypothetical protein EYZ11_008964 [Aspergillus tanneri]